MTVEGTVSLPAAERWAAVPRRWRIVLVAVAAVVAVELAVSLTGGIVGSPTPTVGTASAFDNSASGASALATLLAQHGHRVTRTAVPPPRPPSRPGATVIVLGPQPWTGRAAAADLAALRRRGGQGGRVVLAGRPPAAGAYRALLGGPTHPPGWAGGTARRLPWPAPPRWWPG